MGKHYFGQKDAFARATDPETSHSAAERVDANKLEAQVYEHLQRTGLTLSSIEIARQIGVHEWSVSPRMAPLERKGFVERCAKRACVNSNGKTSMMVTWRAKPLSASQVAVVDPQYAMKI